MNKELEDRLRAHLWKEFNGYDALRYVRMYLGKKTGYSIHICCLSSKAHKVELYMRNALGLHACKVSPYIETLGADWRNYTKLFWDNIAQEELDNIDVLLRMRG